MGHGVHSTSDQIRHHHLLSAIHCWYLTLFNSETNIEECCNTLVYYYLRTNQLVFRFDPFCSYPEERFLQVPVFAIWLVALDTCACCIHITFSDKEYV